MGEYFYHRKFGENRKVPNKTKIIGKSGKLVNKTKIIGKSHDQH